MTGYSSFAKFKSKVNPLLLPHGEKHARWTGCELYSYQESATGYNRMPVDRHLAFITGGASLSGEFNAHGVSFEDVALRVIRDGALLYYEGHVSEEQYCAGMEMYQGLVDSADAFYFELMGEIESEDIEAPTIVDELGGFVDPIIHASENHAVQRLNDGSLRVWRRFKSEWLVTTYTLTDGKFEHSDDPDDTYLLELDAVQLFYFDTGLVTPAQTTFWEIEDIVSALKRLRTQIALSKVIIGYVGDDEQQFHDVMNGERSYVNLPSGTQVVELGNTAATTQLIDQLKALTPLFYEQVHLVVGTEASNESGIAKKIRLFPELTYQEKKRDQIAEVCAAFGVEILWERLQLLTTAEQRDQYTFWKELVADGQMTAEELQQKTRGLI